MSTAYQDPSLFPLTLRQACQLLYGCLQMIGSSARMTTASTSWLFGQSARFCKLCNTDLSDLRSSHAYLIRNLLSSILIMFITCPFLFCNMEFLSIHSGALWTLMFSLSRGQHLCAVAVTADGEKVAFLGGCFIQNPRF